MIDIWDHASTNQKMLHDLILINMEFSMKFVNSILSYT